MNPKLFFTPSAQLSVAPEGAQTEEPDKIMVALPTDPSRLIDEAGVYDITGLHPLLRQYLQHAYSQGFQVGRVQGHQEEQAAFQAGGFHTASSIDHDLNGLLRVCEEEMNNVHHHGVQQGQRTGQQQGFDQGRHWQRVEQGNRAWRVGKGQGYNEGHQQGHQEGHQRGFQQGLQEGFDQGRREGYADIVDGQPSLRTHRVMRVTR